MFSFQVSVLLCEICINDVDSQVHTLHAITTVDQTLTLSVCTHTDNNFTSWTEDGINQGSNQVDPVRAGTHPFGQSSKVISRTICSLTQSKLKLQQTN